MQRKNMQLVRLQGVANLNQDLGPKSEYRNRLGLRSSSSCVRGFVTPPRLQIDTKRIFFD